MNGWSDGKRFLFEHIIDLILYIGLLVFGCFGDLILNGLCSWGFSVVPHESGSHPYEWGNYQIVGAVVGAYQLYRLIKKLDEWRYYR